MLKEELIEKMSKCAQSDQESVYEHGLAVYIWTKIFIKSLKDPNYIYDDCVLPKWFKEYREEILNSLLPIEIIEEYTIYHDCSKPFCKVIDENGKQHFPNHAQESGRIWREVGGTEQASKLMEMDMMIHTMKADDIPSFIKNKEAITLLIVALSEIHANGEIFGGFDSTSFKIKWKQINKKGAKICQMLWGIK